jgi:DNA-binding XRE family transcriptional regulator
MLHSVGLRDVACSWGVNVAEAKKIALINLADLRSDLGLTQDQMADAIKPMTRQTLGTIENGDPKDALFLRGMFDRLKAAFGHRFDSFDLVAESSGSNRFFIRYANLQEAKADDEDFDREAYRILELQHKINCSMKGDLKFLYEQDSYLRALHETLHDWFEKDIQVPRLATVRK